MAGCGRNYPVLEKFFNDITMLEQAKAMTKDWNKNIIPLIMPA